jgi:hypothetical protein
MSKMVVTPVDHRHDHLADLVHQPRVQHFAVERPAALEHQPCAAE